MYLSQFLQCFQRVRNDEEIESRELRIENWLRIITLHSTLNSQLSILNLFKLFLRDHKVSDTPGVQFGDVADSTIAFGG